MAVSTKAARTEMTPTNQASTPTPAAMITAATMDGPARTNFHHAPVDIGAPTGLLRRQATAPIAPATTETHIPAMNTATLVPVTNAASAAPAATASSTPRVSEVYGILGDSHHRAGWMNAAAG
jgi:hypothetical protein